MKAIWSKLKAVLKHDIRFNLGTEVSFKVAAMIVAIFVCIIYFLSQFLLKNIFLADNQGFYEKKIEILQSGKTEITNYDTQNELALTYYLKGDITNALKLYKNILDKQADNPGANTYYGLTLADQKRYSDAIPYLEKGKQLESGREKLTYLYLGICYYNLKDYDKAFNNFQTSVHLTPGNPIPQYYLGLIYRRRNDYSRARAWLSKAIKVSGGNYPEAARELSSLPAN